MAMKTHGRGLDRSKWKGQQYQSTDAEQETIVLLNSLTDAWYRTVSTLWCQQQQTRSNKKDESIRSDINPTYVL